MRNTRKFYIDGAWVDPIDGIDLDVIDPSTEEVCATISNGGAKDADRAVAAAKAAFAGWKNTSPEKRLAYVEKILALYKARSEEIAKTISIEMGAPIDMAYWCGGPDYAMELANEPNDVKGYSCLAGRLYIGSQTFRNCTTFLLDFCRNYR